MIAQKPGKRVDKPQIFMLDLDCLFDTRLSVLHAYSPEAAAKALDSGYHDRLIDEYDGLSSAAFKKLYDARKKDCLKGTFVTCFMDVLKEFTQKTLERSLATPFSGKPIIRLNTFPYEINDDEAHVLISAIKDGTYGYADIEIVFMSPEEITPMYVRKELTYFAMYHYFDWFELHSVNGSLKKTTIPEVSVIGPAIFFKPFTGNRESAFETFRNLIKEVAPIAELNLLPVATFSVKIVAPKQKSQGEGNVSGSEQSA